MLKNLGRLSLAIVLAASTFAAATTAEARGYRGRGDDAAIAIGAGIVGIAIGAAIADNHDDRYYYRDSGYYRPYPDRYYYYRERRYYRPHYDYRYRNHYRERDYRDYRHDRRGYYGNRRWGR